MADKLSEVAKRLGETRKNSEDAIRRFQAFHPKIDRIRDTFDNIIPFEMEWDTEPQSKLMTLDLYFNKPPPSCHTAGEVGMCCEDFTVGPGSHLVQVGSPPYVSGSLTVFINGFLQTRNITYDERDPSLGLVYVVGSDDATVQYIDICYLNT